MRCQRPERAVSQKSNLWQGNPAIITYPLGLDVGGISDINNAEHGRADGLVVCHNAAAEDEEALLPV